MTERLTCRAPHPDPRKVRLVCHAPHPKIKHQRCGAFLGYAGYPVEFDTTAERPPRDPDGSDWRLCRLCKAWSRFRVIEAA